MRKALYIFIFGFIALAAVFLLGPRPAYQASIQFDAASIGGDPAAYLADAEAKIEGIRENAHKEIIWSASGPNVKTKYAVIYIHGFSASKSETRPVPDKIAKALGANLYFTRLNGHGIDGKALANASLQSWIDDYAEAIAIGEKIGEKLIIIATSNGATLDIYGLRHEALQKSVAAHVFISPNFSLKSASTALMNMPWGQTLLPLLVGQTRTWKPDNKVDANAWTTSYPLKAIFPMAGLLRAIETTSFGALRVPAMFIYSPQDKVVDVSKIKSVYDLWGGEKNVLVIDEPEDKSKHVIVGDIRSPSKTQPAVNAILTWLNGSVLNVGK